MTEPLIIADFRLLIDDSGFSIFNQQSEIGNFSATILA